MDEIAVALKEHEMQLETSKVRDRFLPYCNGKVLDIGCSRDKIAPEATGMDDDPAPEVDIVGNVAERLPFADGQFNTIWSSHCLEDLMDTEGALRGWLRCLAVGGHIGLYLPHKDLYKGVNLDHRHEFVNADITSLLERLGCRVVVDEVDDGPGRYSMFIVAVKER